VIHQDSDSGDVSDAFRHRVIALVDDGTAKLVHRFMTAEAAQDRRETLQLKYPAVTYIYCPPTGWEHYKQGEWEQ
jgi:hypothetical protein